MLIFHSQVFFWLFDNFWNCYFVHRICWFCFHLTCQAHIDFLSSFTLKERLLLAIMSKVGNMFLCCSSSNKYNRIDEKLGRKMVEVKRNLAGHDNFKSLNGIILRFPQFREGLQNIRGVFEQYGELYFSCITLFEILLLWIFSHSLSVSHRWRFQWKHRSRRTQEMLTAAANAYDRGRSWGSFPLLWHWWKFWNTVQRVYRSSMSHLSPQGPAFAHRKHKLFIQFSICLLFLGITIQDVCYRNQSWVHLNLKQLLTP